MQHLLGAIVSMLICTRCLNTSHKLYVEEKGWDGKAISIIYATLGIAAGLLSYMCLDQFITLMGWRQ
jgi:hypothetical protein